VLGRASLCICCYLIFDVIMAILVIVLVAPLLVQITKAVAELCSIKVLNKEQCMVTADDGCAC